MGHAMGIFGTLHLWQYNEAFGMCSLRVWMHSFYGQPLKSVSQGLTGKVAPASIPAAAVGAVQWRGSTPQHHPTPSSRWWCAAVIAGPPRMVAWYDCSGSHDSVVSSSWEHPPLLHTRITR